MSLNSDETLCSVCYGTGKNPDDDNNPCAWCQASGFLKKKEVSQSNPNPLIKCSLCSGSGLVIDRGFRDKRCGWCGGSGVKTSPYDN